MKTVTAHYQRGFSLILTLVILITGMLIFMSQMEGNKAPEDHIQMNAQKMLEEGRQIFRFETFGDEKFWSDQLKIHQAIQGTKFGGVGDGVSPKTALAVGLKVDMDAIPAAVAKDIKDGKINLDDPATTLSLIKLNAVVGVVGQFNSNGSLKAIGLSCAVCHSSVDDAFMPGIGHRLDGWANRDLNVGKIVSLAPDLSPYTKLLGVDEATVKKVLASWGPGKFDAELNLDGKAFRPDGKPAATLLPPAFGLAGVNNHTWTGGWGNVTYWNAYVANLELSGQGTFYDERLMNKEQYPIAAKAGFGNNTHKPADIGIDDFQANRSPSKSYRTAPLKGLWTHQKGGFYHDGRFANLMDVVNHYNNFKKLGLTNSEKEDLIQYLLSLWGLRFFAGLCGEFLKL